MLSGTGSEARTYTESKTQEAYREMHRLGDEVIQHRARADPAELYVAALDQDVSQLKLELKRARNP